MPSRHLIRAFFALWWILGGLLVAYSVQTAWHALRSGTDGASLHIAALAAVETVAAVLFLIPSTMRVAGACLLAVFALAFVLHAARGELASQLLLYSAGVAFIMAHGRVPFGMLLGHAKQSQSKPNA
jgi:hypothetical protein